MPSIKTRTASQEIDDYINGLQPFAKDICNALRTIILAAVPGIKEEWKWGPHYSYDGMICGYGGFKQHAKLTFFNGNAMSDKDGLFNHCIDNEFSRSVKFTHISEVNAKQLAAYVKESARLNEQGYKREIKNKTVDVPKDLIAALKKQKAALKFFEELSYGYKKEYVEWITTAKRPETRAGRIAKTVAKCAAGEKLNDKYK